VQPVRGLKKKERGVGRGCVEKSITCDHENIASTLALVRVAPRVFPARFVL
jgi:hypothetical protein